MAKDFTADRFLAAVRSHWHGAEVLAVVPVLWDGWELDNRVALVRTGGAPFLVGSDHGRPVRVEADFLQERVDAYLDLVVRSREVLALLAAGAQ